MTVATSAPATTIEPCRDDAQLREYIDAHWKQGHILARDPRMFSFQYRTPWVDRNVWPGGTSVLCIYDKSGGAGSGRLLGFLGSIVAPYPRPQSYWLALWHVLPELKGGGTGGKLLQKMQEIAYAQDGWIGTFGAGPEALPVYLKRGYCCRAVRRWLYEPAGPARQSAATTSTTAFPARHSAESLPNEEWTAYRFDRHPIFKYERRAGGIFRTEDNSWGTVTHAVRLHESWPRDASDVFERDSAKARASGLNHLMDTWSFDCPGPGWSLAGEGVPSVFHPPQARGSVVYAVGRPFIPTMVDKSDCDQDRPN